MIVSGILDRLIGPGGAGTLRMRPLLLGRESLSPGGGYRCGGGWCHAVGVEELDQREAGFDAQERRRRRLAQRLALELATASHREGSDFVASRLVQVRYSSTFEVQSAMSQAPTVVFMGDRADVGVCTGRGGTVMYVHMPDLWSVVFPLEPFTGLVLVCVDDLKDHCMQLYDDSPESRAAVDDFHTRVVLALRDRAEYIARGSLPPDPAPLPVPE